MYGTLREGCPAFQPELSGRVESIQPGWLDDYALYGRGLPYPYVRGEPGARVRGEVMTLSRPEETLVDLDAFEGSEYERVERRVTLDTEEIVNAWVYVAREWVPLGVDLRIDSGDWRAG